MVRNVARTTEPAHLCGSVIVVMMSSNLLGAAHFARATDQATITNCVANPDMRCTFFRMAFLVDFYVSIRELPATFGIIVGEFILPLMFKISFSPYLCANSCTLFTFGHMPICVSVIAMEVRERLLPPADLAGFCEHIRTGWYHSDRRRWVPCWYCAVGSRLVQQRLGYQLRRSPRMAGSRVRVQRHLVQQLL